MAKGDGFSSDDPLYRAMLEIIWSPEGKQAAIDSTNAGIPALSGVDLLLQQKLPGQYRRLTPANTSPQLPLVVGAHVANVMRALGYKEAGRGSCPSECVARSGQIWKPKG